jgi:hypothetical protein
MLTSVTSSSTTSPAMRCATTRWDADRRTLAGQPRRWAVALGMARQPTVLALHARLRAVPVESGTVRGGLVRVSTKRISRESMIPHSLWNQIVRNCLAGAEARWRRSRVKPSASSCPKPCDGIYRCIAIEFPLLLEQRASASGITDSHFYRCKPAGTGGSISSSSSPPSCALRSQARYRHRRSPRSRSERKGIKEAIHPAPSSAPSPSD